MTGQRTLFETDAEYTARIAAAAKRRRHWKPSKPYRLSELDIKAVVRHRDGYRCQECGMTARQHFKKYRRTLDVHRLVPGSKYDLSGTMTLCCPCHKKAHVALSGGKRKGKALSVHLPPDLSKALRCYCKKTGCSTAEVARAALRFYLAQHGFPVATPLDLKAGKDA